MKAEGNASRPVWCPHQRRAECETPNACAGGADCRLGPDPELQRTNILNPTTARWKSIETAPREPFALDVPMDNPDIPYRRLRMGPEIKVRGTHDGLTEEFRAVWTVEDDRPGFWFGDATEPIDWPLSEWRPLTQAEINDAQS